MIIFYVFVALGLISFGVFMEHYLGPKQKLDTDELFQAFDLIDVQCDRDYEKTTAMRQEFWVWMNNPVAITGQLSSELQYVLKTVKGVEGLKKVDWFNS